MSHLKKTTVLGIAAAIALAGCSSSSPEETSAPDAGQTFTGSTYSFSAPEGWEELDDEAATAGLDIVVLDATDNDGFTDNMNVLDAVAGEVTPDEVEADGVAELEGAGATDVRARDRVTVAGSESANLSAAMSVESNEYQIEQFYLTDDGQTYIVTFSFSSSVSKLDRDAVTMSVLESWTWA